MLVTLYQSAADEHPQPRELLHFDDLAKVLGDEHLIKQPFKNAKGKIKTPIHTPAFSPCEFDGAGRKQQNVIRVHFGAADLDKLTYADFTAFCEKMQTLRSFVYSTFSHGYDEQGNPALGYVSARFMFPISRPVSLEEWPHFWAGCCHLSGGILDGQTKNADRLYYVPVRRPDAHLHDATRPFLLFSAGVPGQDTLNVDATIEIGKANPQERGRISGRKRSSSTALTQSKEDTGAQGQAFTKHDLLDVANTLKRSKSSKLKEVGRCIDAVAAGTVYAKDLERDATLFRMCSQIAEYFPNADPQQVAELFRQSIGATNALIGNGDEIEDLNKVYEKLVRCQAQVRERMEATKADHEKSLRADIQAAFAYHGIERDHPYTEEEISRIKEEIKAPSYEELMKSWIIQNGGSFYVLFNGSYLPPITEKALVTSLRRDLAPAITADVMLHDVTDNGTVVTLTKDMILSKYGTVARGTLVDLNAQRTEYDRSRQLIIEAPCPLRTDIVPTYHPAIEEWLTALGGDAPEKLKQWVAFVTHLDQACVAVYLDGGPGVGKTLFAKALSRLWTTGGPTEIRDVLVSNFNDAVLGCPLVFADEALPKDILGEGTAILREFQQNTTRKLHRKFMPRADMIGAIRLIMASNNRNMIETTEALTSVDIEAISERILYLKASDRARDVLRSWGSDVKRVVTDNILAEHALWLRDQAGGSVKAPHGRFMIQNDNDTLTRALTTHAGARAVICHWLVSYLQKPSKFDSIGTYLCHVRDGELLVNAQALTESWELYVTNSKPPATHKISQALAGISHAQRRQVRVNKAKVNFYVVDTQNLITWAEENGISSGDEILEALKVPTKMSASSAITMVSAQQPQQVKP